MPRYKVKRRNTQEAKEMQEFARRFKAKRVGTQVTFQSSGEKMSEVLEEFLSTYTHIPKTFDEYNRLVAVGIMAWNAAILPSAERQQLLDKAIEALPASSGHEARQDLKAILDELIERKERYFGGNKRFVLDYHLSDTKAGYHLSVISTT
jgi:hypothetical protein